MWFDVFETYDFGNEQKPKTTLEKEKKEISKFAYQDLAAMKAKIEFNRDQIKNLEKELWKRFKVSNVLNKIIEDEEIDKYELQAFMIEFTNWTFDRYYSKNWEIKEITETQKQQIKEAISNILEKIIENWYKIYSNDDINFLESLWYKVPENIEKWSIVSIKENTDKELEVLWIFENLSLNDNKITFKQTNTIDKVWRTWLSTLLWFMLLKWPWAIAWFLWSVWSQTYSYNKNEEIKEEITNDLYQIDESFKN